MKLSPLFPAICLLALSASQAPAAGLRAGAALSSITPPLGSDIVGGFAPMPSTEVHDELQARCLVLDDGRSRLALVVCDLLGLHRSVSLEARRLIEQAIGIPPTHVMISATHTHSAVSALGSNRFEADVPLDDYQRHVARRIAEGVQAAAKHLRPARVGFGKVLAPEHLKNRRWFMQESSKALLNPFGKTDRVKMNAPVADPGLLESAGTIDPTLSFIAVTGLDGNPISVYAAYSLHYVGGTSPGHISADYFAVFSEALKRSLASPDSEFPFVAMMANGASGDVTGVHRWRAQPPKPPYQAMREVGEALAAKVKAALERVSWQPTTTLDARFRELPLRWREITPEMLAWAKEIQAKAPRLTRGQIPRDATHPTTPDYIVPLSYAGRFQTMARSKQPNAAPVQVVRIGDICIGGMSGEPFAEVGLEFKQRSPFRNSFMVSLVHAHLGYLPTLRHFEYGGYETWPGVNFLEPAAAGVMLEEVLHMAGELHAEGEKG